MSDGGTTAGTVEPLGRAVRWVCGIAGFVLIATAFFVFYFAQPGKTTNELNADGSQKSTTTENRDTTVPFTVLVLSGVVLAIFAVNGKTISKVSVGKDGAEMDFTNPQNQEAIAESIARVSIPRTSGRGVTPANAGRIAASTALAVMASPTSRRKISGAIKTSPGNTKTLDQVLKEILAEQ